MVHQCTPLTTVAVHYTIHHCKPTYSCRAKVGGARTLPEMLFDASRVTLTHEASGTVLDFNAQDALSGWHAERLPPLQVKLAQVGGLTWQGGLGWRVCW